MTQPSPRPKAGDPQTQRAWLFGAVGGLLAVSAFFFYRQNWTGQIGGQMSLAKLLWLDYALIAWIGLPVYFWRSGLVSEALRRLYGGHVALWAARGVIELWLLYVTHTWIPPYGMVHGVLTIGLLSYRGARLPTELPAPLDGTARRFLTSIRLALCFEILFAWLFYQAVRHDTSHTWFASDRPEFAFINTLTWAVVLVAGTDLLRVLWRVRQAGEVPGNGLGG